MPEVCYVLPERFHGCVAVIPCDVVMELFPETLDGIVLRRVGRQKVEFYFPVHRCERTQGLLGLVDNIVVENEMQGPRASVGATQFLKERDEQSGVFPGTMRVDNASCSSPDSSPTLLTKAETFRITSLEQRC